MQKAVEAELADESTELCCSMYAYEVEEKVEKEERGA